MAGFNFADHYRAAGLNPGPDIIRLRQEPFDSLRKDISASDVVGLTRLYFGLPLPAGADWFREAFAETDPSFSMLDNEREAAVLSACLLAAVFEDGDVVAALAPLAASLAGKRVPLVQPQFLEVARSGLHERAVDARLHRDADPKLIKPPAKSNTPAAVQELLQAPEWERAGAILSQISQESTAGTTNLATQVRNVVSSLAAQVASLREEVEMLWWYIGGWSRVLDRPFTELEPALAAAMAGLDLAHLTAGEVGPAAAPAILHRLISAGRKGKPTKVAIKDAVDAFPAAAAERLSLGDSLRAVADICPVLAAFQKASEIGVGPAWHAAYRNAALADPDTALLPLDLAMQVYREALLLALLD